ncbi:hypothetical protein ZWY2020_011360, partial [Hordeum vulgare]
IYGITLVKICTYAESKGHNFALDATFDDVSAAAYDGLVIPGGRAPEYLAMDEKVLALVRKFSDAKKPIASVCHGQLILGADGVVRDRTCTAYPAVKPVLVAAGLHGGLRGDGPIPGPASPWLPCRHGFPDKGAGDKCQTAIHDFKATRLSAKPGHDFAFNASFEGVDASSYDSLVIPGGRAPEYLALNEKILSLAKWFMDKGKSVASIYHGQQILAAAGFFSYVITDIH